MVVHQLFPTVIKDIEGGYSEGEHLFPFRTEKLSPSAPMVLPDGGRVGRRLYFTKPTPLLSLVEALLFLFSSLYKGIKFGGVEKNSYLCSTKKCALYRWRIFF